MADDSNQNSPEEREAQLKRQQSGARNRGGQNTNQGNATPGTPTSGSFPGASPKTNTRGGSTSRPSPGSGGQMGGVINRQAGQQGGKLAGAASGIANQARFTMAKAQSANQQRGSGGGGKPLEQRAREEVGKRTAQFIAAATGVGALGEGVAGKVGAKLAGSKVGKYVIWGGCAAYGLFWFLVITLIIVIPILYVKSQCDIKNNTAIVRFVRGFFSTGTFGLTEVGLKALCDQIK